MTATVTPVPARPVLAVHVLLHEPPQPGAQWVVHAGGSRYLRVGSDVAQLLAALGKGLDHAGLARALGAPWTPEQVAESVMTLQRLGLLAGGTALARSPGRLAMAGPLSVQLTLLDPSQFLGRLRPVLRPVLRPGAAWAAAILAVAGLFALAASAAAIRTILDTPLSPAAYLAVLGCMLLGSCLHELGHGAVLTHFGGRPHRMGVILLYLTPGFFCDVSDGWRLPQRRQRVAVALAGVTTQWVLAGAAALSQVAVPDGTPRDVLVVFAVLSYVSGLLNLVPLIKLDGYLALMSHVDVPHLRATAMADARSWVAAVLLGSSRTRELERLDWAVPYGLLCLAFPGYLLATALALWSGILLRLGTLGAVILLAAFCWGGYRLGRRYLHWAGDGLRAGAARWRVGAVSGLLCAGTALALWAVSVPETVAGGYIRHGDGIELLLPEGTDASAVRTGMLVTLTRSGLLGSSELARTVVTDDHSHASSAPLSALTPLDTDSIRLAATAFSLRPVTGPLPLAGTAELDLGHRPLAEWLFDTYAAAPMRAVLP